MSQNQNMNKVYLDKLCNFALTTYKNYEFTNKNVDLNDYINNIKQNQSLNEKGIFFKHNFIELKTLIANIEYDELVLINPLCFNLSSNIQWFNFLNAILTVLNDNYLHESNLIKKTILETADKTFRKKIIIADKIDDNIIDQICELTNITLIMFVNQHEIQFFNYKNINHVKKIVVMVNDDKEYFSVLNWNQKYYNLNSEFINYLMNTNDLNKISNKINNDNDNKNKDNEFIKVVNKKKHKILNDDIIDNIKSDSIKSTKSIKSNKSIKSAKSTKLNNNMFDFNDDDETDDDKINNINIEPNNIKSDDEEENMTNIGTYEELQADVNYAMYISEVVDNPNKISNKNVSSKKKKKNDKNIFVKDDDKKSINCKKNINCDMVNDDNETSIFNKTEKITKKEVDEIYNNVKLSMGLEIIQAHALKLGISIFEGSTKSGKPKNKTKTDLIEQIKYFAKNFSK